MKKAVLVFNSEPILGNLMASQIRFDGNVKRYLKALQAGISQLNLPWQVSLDQSFGDVATLLAADNQLLICAPGLEEQLVYKDTDQDKLLFLTSLEFHGNDVQRVLAMMQRIS
ncbi:hypothetical protein [Lapidilactobacillus wuchangensis]|uniref:hypothetical protein n=1 Tax=Lapidilactobacillus wuchangensis TaxID=2486001 RepID=UPI000F7966B9|nr:hypothetical protein [Lapidilactobacillus wuchangensis]